MHRRIIVLDTETTGVMRYDKLIALAAIRFEDGQYRDHIYRIYDPRTDNHPDALNIHGWDDWMLRFQPLFAEEADEVRTWLDWADCIVMHNAAFDMHYVERELRKAERAPLEKPSYCTMQEARVRWPGQSAKLGNCVSRLGLGLQAERHDAFQDAFLTARMYFHMVRGPAFAMWPLPWPRPTNLLPAPPRPNDPLPRRDRKTLGWRTMASKPDSVPMQRSWRREVDRARDGQLLIRFAGVQANIPIKFQLAAIDAYSDHVATTLGIPADEAFRQALRGSAMAMIGSQNGATTGSKRLASDRAELAVVLPIIMEMAKRDGTLTASEDRAIRHIFASVREASAAPNST